MELSEKDLAAIAHVKELDARAIEEFVGIVDDLRALQPKIHKINDQFVGAGPEGGAVRGILGNLKQAVDTAISHGSQISMTNGEASRGALPPPGQQPPTPAPPTST